MALSFWFASGRFGFALHGLGCQDVSFERSLHFWDTLLALIGDLFLASLRAPSGCAILDSLWVTFRVSGLAEEMKNPLCQPIELGTCLGANSALMKPAVTLAWPLATRLLNKISIDEKC